MTNLHCSIEALKNQHDISTSIEHRTHQLFLEVPEPWERVYGLSPEFPPNLLPVLQTFTKTFVKTSISIFAPDPEYSSADGLRVIYLRVKSTLKYERWEYVIPPKKMTEALSQLLTVQDPGTLDLLKGYTVPNSQRDFFICTHMNRDRCCGVFGNELYAKLRNDPVLEKKSFRIFRSSHIGGHRYAPTMLEGSSLRCWGYLTEERARQIILRTGDITPILDHYRGCAALGSPYFQVAEKEMLRKYGWDWFQFTQKSFLGEVQDTSTDVTVSFANKESSKIQHTLKIANSTPVDLRANCDEDKISSFPQYRVLS